MPLRASSIRNCATTAGLPSVALQRAPMRNLAGTNMPAVLIEMGYLSNAEEEKLLTSSEFQNGIALALTEAVAAFRDHVEQEPQAHPQRHEEEDAARIRARTSGLPRVLVAGLITLLVLGPRWLATVPDEAATGRDARGGGAQDPRAAFLCRRAGHRPAGRRAGSPLRRGHGRAGPPHRRSADCAARPSRHVSAIPAGTKLRTVFFTKAGEIYVDLSADVQTNHPGGTTNETLTVYALVSALTSNLPAVTSVQILVDGKEVDTLAGHLDLRRPIEQDLKWVTN